MRWILLLALLLASGCQTTMTFTYHSRYGDVSLQAKGM